MDKKEIVEKISTELKLQGKSERTIRMYCFFNEKFIDFIKKDVNEISQDDVKKFLGFMLNKKNDVGSVALARSSLRFFYDEVLQKGITANIKTPKKQRRLPDVLSKEEIKLLINSAKKLKNKLFIEIMYSSGLRVSECANLKVKDLNLEDKTGLLKFGKGGKDRFFILSEKVIVDLKEYLENHNSEYLFPGVNGSIGTRAIQRAVKRTAQIAGIKKKVYCHLLRHAFATHLLEDGVDIRKIQMLLAHSNLQTTSFYTQVSKEQLKKVRSPLDTI